MLTSREAIGPSVCLILISRCVEVDQSEVDQIEVDQRQF